MKIHLLFLSIVTIGNQSIKLKIKCTKLLQWMLTLHLLLTLLSKTTEFLMPFRKKLITDFLIFKNIEEKTPRLFQSNNYDINFGITSILFK